MSTVLKILLGLVVLLIVAAAIAGIYLVLGAGPKPKHPKSEPPNRRPGNTKANNRNEG